MLPKAHASNESSAPVVMKSRAELVAGATAPAPTPSVGATGDVSTAAASSNADSKAVAAKVAPSNTVASDVKSANGSAAAANAVAANSKAATAAVAAPAIAPTTVAPAVANAPTKPTTVSTSASTTQAVPVTAAPVTAPSAPAATVVSAPASVAATATAPVPAPATPSESSEKTASPAPVAAPVAAVKAPLPPGVKYRDGEYYGWGTSRHGDIQAYVEVTDGKVSYVKIAQCLTQYSCGLIDVLPGQVFQRNGPEVDAVSGATQSSIAFYGAVNQALAKAK